jgi:hypothetical protein
MNLGATPLYIRELERARLAAASRSPPSPPSSLRQRFVDWYGALPEFARNRPFSMSQFETALKAQGKQISPVLLQLGWRRKRIWSTTAQYHRYWQPPPLAE